MPVYVVDGIRYRIRLTSIFRPRTLCKDLMATDAYRRARVAAKHNTNFWHTETETEALWTDTVGNTSGNDDASRWSRGGGRVLHQLETSEALWKQFPSALGDSYVEELKHRLDEIRGDRLQSIRQEDCKTSWHSSNLPYNSKITSPDHLAICPLVIDGKFEEVEDGEEYEGTSHQYYDGDYTMEEVTLLRKIAAQWKRDQWQTISTRFNGMTGRRITPEQAKSVLDSNQG
ncbi:hypothetical protein KXX33_006040 [Aspergillus fumigatus]|nr:hypothetical protein KXX45_001193 [Aspergillus fumigatus]KAH1325900.1 hypothetical protein KXX66_000051 [Aspergillus fumigatus]KAH1358930.1 hypothetical protein KXX33_006040 [Aspergillus fumigatus]KAH1368972.1 hypothetical protein KXX63_008061 [Aspergillus fumigatus]KAH1411469.1 hypothetical protein KXX51_001219 [Aspergillus fumigatus]